MQLRIRLLLFVCFSLRVTTGCYAQEDNLFSPSGQGRKPVCASIRTNLLYDAALVPNIGAEFYLGNDWAIYGNYVHGWWSKNSGHRYWRIYGGELGIRRYMGCRCYDSPITGHHLGVYTQIVTYDFEFGGKGQMGGTPGRTILDRANYGAGIEYGYTLPVHRRLNIDFSIGVGYLGGKYIEYRPDDRFYVWEKIHRRNWFGPTKLEISLIYLLGKGHVNATEGGR